MEFRRVLFRSEAGEVAEEGDLQWRNCAAGQLRQHEHEGDEKGAEGDPAHRLREIARHGTQRLGGQRAAMAAAAPAMTPALVRLARRSARGERSTRRAWEARPAQARSIVASTMSRVAISSSQPTRVTALRSIMAGRRARSHTMIFGLPRVTAMPQEPSFTGETAPPWRSAA